MDITKQEPDYYEDSIAIIAMNGRFPGANSIEEFWSNLENGIESISRLNKNELIEQGVSEELIENPSFVSAEGIVPNVDLFDAAFFNVSPREAELLDPQHRLFLEAVWELLESAGYSTETYKGLIGVYGGAASSSYLTRNLLSHPEFILETGSFKTSLATGQDFVTTRVSYKMGFQGPSINVNTLCSSSAVAVHLARESLLNYQCDLAIAGCANLSGSREDSLFYQEGGIGAYDGHCRAFDAKASGTVAGNGLAIVALKRMEEALKEGDQILAVIRGTAINNDGADKASYTAPSPEGQARVITEALTVANVHPDSISYVEAHGTGTNIGDPIEVAGLTQAYIRKTDRKQYCALGSVKTNIGHLVSAGGIASLIKTVLAMQNSKIPASLNYKEANPKIDFENSPFYVNDTLKDWIPEDGQPKRAGVSSFGIGGTNAHIILEEAPPLPIREKELLNSTHWFCILLSAKTETALVAVKSNLRDYLLNHPNTNLSDLEYTLKVGRNRFEYKCQILCNSIESLTKKLNCDTSSQSGQIKQKSTHRPLTMMFAGAGGQYIGMGESLYEDYPVYRDHIDQCCHVLQAYIDIDLKKLLFPQSGEKEDARIKLRQTVYAQPALFVTEYALAKLWMSWGMQIESMIGHSDGEYVAACLAGVMSLEQTLELVAKRSILLNELAPASMLSIPLSYEQLKPFLSGNVFHSLENSASQNVVCGNEQDLKVLSDKLEQQGIIASEIQATHAFHTQKMKSVESKLASLFDSIELKAPTIPYISNVTGDWIEAEQATNVDYWVQHLLSPARFAKGIEKLINCDENRVYLEVGPGNGLSSFVRASSVKKNLIIHTLPHWKLANEENKFIQTAIGNLWSTGIPIDWNKIYANQKLNRISLPTYPFERKRFWISPSAQYGRSKKIDYCIQSLDDLTSIDENQVDISKITMAFDLPLIAEKVNTKNQLTELLALKTEFEARISSMNSKFETNNNIGRIELEISSNVDTASKVGDLASGAIQDNRPTVQNENLRPQTESDYICPKNDTEIKLVQHWEEVLGYSPVGTEDDFFEVGGHSLMAAAIVSKIRKSFGLDIPLEELLSTSTISELAKLIKTKQWILGGEEVDNESIEREIIEI